MRPLTQLHPLALLLLLARLRLARAHSDHSFDLDDQDDAGMPYAERHMHTEHHIDSFDLESFFKLHDLDLDGYWDRPEIEAVYGLHHHSTLPKENGHQHQHGAQHTEGVAESGSGSGLGQRAPVIVAEVLRKLDKNEDERISLQEFLDGGPEGLPSFAGYKDLGHHYDEESEYFLHHEELYHNTPETQTDDSYDHPEDIEHFRHHARIEDEEDARERKFEGLPATADLAKDHVIVDTLEKHEHAPGEGPPNANAEHSNAPQAGDEAAPPPPRLHREAKEAGPNRLGDELKDEWERARNGITGEHRQRTADERLRAGGTYKSKFRKGLRSDEF